MLEDVPQFLCLREPKSKFLKLLKPSEVYTSSVWIFNYTQYGIICHWYDKYKISKIYTIDVLKIGENEAIDLFYLFLEHEKKESRMRKWNGVRSLVVLFCRKSSQKNHTNTVPFIFWVNSTLKKRQIWKTQQMQQISTKENIIL